LSCQNERGLIQSYVDGELDELHASKMKQHLDRCEECRSAHVIELMLRSSLRDTSLYQRAPEDLEKRIRLSLQRETRGEKPSDDED
jgi:Predicted transmembrane transcriptional regulator (anti-sigma factor)